MTNKNVAYHHTYQRQHTAKYKIAKDLKPAIGIVPGEILIT